MGKKKRLQQLHPLHCTMLSFSVSTLDTFTFAYFIEEQKSSLVLLCAGTLSCNCLFIYSFILINFAKRPGSSTEQAPLQGQEKLYTGILGYSLVTTYLNTPLTLFFCIAGGDPESNGRQRHSKITATVGLVVHAAGKGRCCY